MAGYIGTQAVSVNTTSATISDDLAVGDDALITGTLTTTAATVFNGGFASNADSTITIDDNGYNLTLISTDADENSGPRLKLQRNSANPAADDFIGLIDFTGQDAGGNETRYANIVTQIASPTAGGEGGKFIIEVATHDAEMQTGFEIIDGNAEDELDVNIANGALSLTTIAGGLSVVGNRSGDFQTKLISTNTYGLLVKTTSTSASHEQVQFVDANDSVLFKVLGNGAATIKNGLALTDGNLTVAAGHGIDFAAQTPTSASGASTVAEILDHYEDGSFTPAITDNSGRAGTQSIQVGRYIRVGRLVHVQGRVSISNLASMGGNIILIGLPFTSLNLSNCFSSLNIGQGANLNITAGFSVCGNFSTNSTAMEIQLYDSTAGSTAMTTGEFSADGDIIFSGSYIAN